MISKQLLENLLCPQDKQSTLAPADEALIDRINQAIAAGRIANQGGRTLDEPLEEGLLRADGAVLYVVRDEIPVMLIDESIKLDQLED
jgi:uncharacterized protein YbaR (Trm112 family)